MKMKTAVLLTVIALLALFLAGCRDDGSVIKSRTLKQGRRKIRVLSYTPDGFDFRGGRTPLLFYMSDTAFTKSSALEKAEANGLKALADRESCSIVFLSPADGKSWGEKDHPRLQVAAGSTKDSWFPGDRTDAGFTDGLFLSSHFRLYFFAEGSAADYVKQTLDVPGADFLISEYGMKCGGFAAGYVCEPEGLTAESVGAGWAAVKDRSRMFTDKDTSRACICPAYDTCGITETLHIYTAGSGRKIEYYEYVPSALPSDAVAPLVVLFHGRGMHPDAYAYQSAWPKVAAGHGFRIISVAGPYDEKFSPDIDKAITADTHALIADYVKTHPVDASRVFATGFSMGAFRALDLGARYPETFAAIAPCDPVKRCIAFSAPMPVFFFGGALDNYNIFPSQNTWCGALVKDMASANGCPLTFDPRADNPWLISFDKERAVTDEDTGLVIHLRELQDSEGRTRIILSEADDMGHSVLPGLSEHIWSFFESVV